MLRVWERRNSPVSPACSSWVRISPMTLGVKGSLRAPLGFRVFKKDDQGDGMGREVGRGFRIRDTCAPVADSCRCMAKTIRVL